MSSRRAEAALCPAGECAAAEATPILKTVVSESVFGQGRDGQTQASYSSYCSKLSREDRVEAGRPGAKWPNYLAMRSPDRTGDPHNVRARNPGEIHKERNYLIRQQERLKNGSFISSPRAQLKNRTNGTLSSQSPLTQVHSPCIDDLVEELVYRRWHSFHIMVDSLCHTAKEMATRPASQPPTW